MFEFHSGIFAAIDLHADDDFQPDCRVSHGLWDADAGGIYYYAAYGGGVLYSAKEFCRGNYRSDQIVAELPA